MIQTTDLVKIFGVNCAVNGINLFVPPGTIYGLVGPDGAGKTTTIRLLCGALRPSQGNVHINGVDMQKHPEEARSHIGYLAQRFALYDDLTVLENLRFFAEVRGLLTREWLPRILEILEFVGLAEFKDRRAGQLSGGMKQKLGLAAALVHRPPVLLLDEPTTGVDPVTRQDFWQLILRLVKEQSVCVFVSTPYMDEAARCMRLGFMVAGRVIVEGSPQELRSRMGNQIVEITGSPLRLARSIALAEPAVEDVLMFGDRIHVHIRPGELDEVIRRLRRELRQSEFSLQSIRPISSTLEDVFIQLMGRETPKEIQNSGVRP